MYMYTKSTQQRIAHISAFFLFVLLAVPVFVFGQEPEAPSKLVPCNGADCTFDDLLILINNIINFIIYVSIPVAGVLFSYAGFLYITDGGSGSRVSQAKSIFQNVAVGFVIGLGAWLVVKVIIGSLVSSETATFLQRFIDLR